MAPRARGQEASLATPVFEPPEVFLKQMYSIEGSTCDIIDIIDIIGTSPCSAPALQSNALCTLYSLQRGLVRFLVVQLKCDRS